MGLRDWVALVEERQGTLESDHVKYQSIWWKRMTKVEGNCMNIPESRVAPTVCLNQKQVTANWISRLWCLAGSLGQHVIIPRTLNVPQVKIEATYDVGASARWLIDGGTCGICEPLQGRWIKPFWHPGNMFRQDVIILQQLNSEVPKIQEMSWKRSGGLDRVELIISIYVCLWCVQRWMTSPGGGLLVSIHRQG